MACWLLEFETKKLDNKAINLIENISKKKVNIRY